MKVFEAPISFEVADLLNNMLRHIPKYEAANNKIIDTFKIKNFFTSQDEFELFKQEISVYESMVSEPDRAEYGDFQTNFDLASSIILFLKDKKTANPKLIIEPTCGKGSFIIAALSVFQHIEKIVGVEIYKPYTWETKFNILEFYISNPLLNKPLIEIHHFNVFDFNFSSLANEFKHDVLVIGNPPWVTNSKLSVLNSDNLPQKSNFKRHTGIDAITGKGNFDIGEFITLMMFDAFQKSDGHFAFLVKNSVIKNVIYDQYQRKYKISDIEKYSINSQKEFDVSVEASLLYCHLNSIPEFTCNEFNFYIQENKIREFGWVNDKFVSNTDLYQDSNYIDGICPFEWRQGIKHDLSLIMEFEKVGDKFLNGKQEEVAIEDDLIYGLLKSSDLKKPVIDRPRKYTIITQKKVGQDTSYIKHNFPKTFVYLHSHLNSFKQRKSSIYYKKPDFSIFGVGEYSFEPYKVAISGLYKTLSFSLILPDHKKPLMLDDTCYLLGFTDLEFAVYTTIILNSDQSKNFLQSITFSDAKRTFTKDVLMRIDLFRLALQLPEMEVQKEINFLNDVYNLRVSLNCWDIYLHALTPKHSNKQMDIFTMM